MLARETHLWVVVTSCKISSDLIPHFLEALKTLTRTLIERLNHLKIMEIWVREWADKIYRSINPELQLTSTILAIYQCKVMLICQAIVIKAVKDRATKDKADNKESSNSSSGHLTSQVFSMMHHFKTCRSKVRISTLTSSV